jgi:hypothetical protein
MHTNDAPPELRMRAAMLGKPVMRDRDTAREAYQRASCFTCSWLVNSAGIHCRNYNDDPDPNIHTLMRQICMDWTAK